MSAALAPIAVAAGALQALPLAHLGHYLWVLYLIPVVIVIGGIIHSTRAERRRAKQGNKRR